MSWLSFLAEQMDSLQLTGGGGKLVFRGLQELLVAAVKKTRHLATKHRPGRSQNSTGAVLPGTKSRLLHAC